MRTHDLIRTFEKLSLVPIVEANRIWIRIAQIGKRYSDPKGFVQRVRLTRSSDPIYFGPCSNAGMQAGAVTAAIRL